MEIEDLAEFKESCQNDVKKKQKPMLRPSMRETLIHQGYKIVGSHSAVKICRWNKSMLRGRGGCYKHTFYGIQSHQCMEMTPSLACANKCIFCWRANTNPVSREWKWTTDTPEEIRDGLLASQRQLLKPTKGIPGVTKTRYEESMTVRHCAMSLVGEPIMYPRISELIALLHARRISTFLVTNTQFPQEVKSLSSVTQLYASVDAATEDSLKRLDRPLFRDFWARYIASLRAMRCHSIRTVIRITLIKGFNMSNPAAYAPLIRLAWPGFIEIKAVTFAGSANSKRITMSNVPFHREVLAFARALCAALREGGGEGEEEQGPGAYSLVSEHKHSCCALLAHERFRIDGHWHTWIDFDRFFACAASGAPFKGTDYCSRTPDWALMGAPGRGFDPKEKRWRRKKKGEGKEEKREAETKGNRKAGDEGENES